MLTRTEFLSLAILLSCPCVTNECIRPKCALIVRLPLIRFFPSFSHVLPAYFGYTPHNRDHGKKIVTQFSVSFTCRRRLARKDHANAQTYSRPRRCSDRCG